MYMRNLILSIAAAGCAAISLIAGPAQAITLVQETDATSVQQTANSPCIFSSGPCSQPALFPTLTDISTDPFSSLTTSQYKVGDLRTLLGGSNTFSIGIDIGVAPGQGNSHNLDRFYVQLVGGGILAGQDYDPASPGPALGTSQVTNPGNGWSDWRLTGFSLEGLDANASVRFFLSLSNMNDGPDQFFLIAEAAPVPLPAAALLMGSVLLGAGGVSAWRRKRRQFAQA